MRFRAKLQGAHMTVFNLGSINADYTYQVPHLPQPSETLAASSMTRGLGGKGANMSVACARAAGRVFHIGAIGEDGAWATDRLLEYGVDTRHISTLEVPTGHAIISVDPEGENSILILPGANTEITEKMIAAAICEGGPQDWLLMQNETNGLKEAADMAKQVGMKIAYAAAPFVAKDAAEIAPLADLLVLNEIEAQQLQDEMNTTLSDLPIADIIVTKGGKGCAWHHGDEVTEFPSYPAEVVDTTGAGDTFTGYVLASLDRGMTIPQAIDLAQQAASLMVQRLGTADVIPDLKEVQDASFGSSQR